jgi:hypothetical protein
MPTIYEYEISFVKDGQRIRVQQIGYNIHEVIKKIRIQYADAKAFIVLKKMKYPHPIG